MMITEQLIGGKTCRLFESGTPSCILLQPSARHETATLQLEAEKIASLSGVPSVLCAFDVEDWMLDLMPWPDGNISREEDAGKRGEATLSFVLTTLLPALRDNYGPLPVVFGGYSLAGLFALWASTVTDSCRAIAAASPSVWIRDWLPFARKHPTLAGKVYLSLGDREEHVRNKAIARVGTCIRDYHEVLKDQIGERNCTLVWEEGNHFADNEGRLARAFAWCMTGCCFRP